MNERTTGRKRVVGIYRSICGNGEIKFDIIVLIPEMGAEEYLPFR
jgi:hypothetical protein